MAIETLYLIRNLHSGYEMWADSEMIGRAVEASVGGIALAPEDWPDGHDDANNAWEIVREAD